MGALPPVWELFVLSDEDTVVSITLLKAANPSMCSSFFLSEVCYWSEKHLIQFAHCWEMCWELPFTYTILAGFLNVLKVFGRHHSYVANRYQVSRILYCGSSSVIIPKTFSRNHACGPHILAYKCCNLIGDGLFTSFSAGPQGILVCCAYTYSKFWIRTGHNESSHFE